MKTKWKIIGGMLMCYKGYRTGVNSAYTRMRELRYTGYKYVEKIKTDDRISWHSKYEIYATPLGKR